MTCERFVDHLALERDGGLAPRRGGVVGGQEAAGAFDLLGRRRERAVGERNLGRVDAELAAGIPSERPSRGIGRKPVVVTECGDDLIDRENAGDPCRQRDARAGVEDLALDAVRTPPMSATKSSAPK